MADLAHALKEWQVAVSALEQGETILLLRKGGIREVGGKFTVQYDRVLLYPTFEHQKPELLKSHFVSQVKPVKAGWHPDEVRIGSWADITHVFHVQHHESTVMELLPFHVWNQDFVTQRLQWKPNQPIFLMLLRVYRLLKPEIIAYSQTYGGCKSWIDLQTYIPIELSNAVLDEKTYGDRVAEIQAILRSS